MRYQTMYCLFCTCVLALFCTLFYSTGHTEDAVIKETSFIRNESTLVLEYRRFNSLLGRTHATVLQAFGDGTVKVTFPPSHLKAGTYSLTMLSSELDTLVADTVQSNQPIEANEQALADNGEYFAVSDSTFTEIDLNIASYTLSSGESITLDSMVSIREIDLVLSSQQLSGPNRLANLSQLEKKLLNLTNDPRMEKQ